MKNNKYDKHFAIKGKICTKMFFRIYLKGEESPSFNNVQADHMIYLKRTKLICHKEGSRNKGKLM